ncbi:leukocyte-specific transcript 1 protein [Artibeus jamaicensis]|uniref:leukocyte-specific transcript 1 protein n=1 Tax=Artibeus jamaicensis TaxID=9417 RepID=UPI00235A6C38|nr:leukocyte-specific transcript 1 protein [Artibeus jamaicensis]
MGTTGKSASSGGRPLLPPPPVGFSTGLSEQELHCASLPALPYCKRPDLRHPDREGSTEDPSTNYACIAENKPT